MQLYPTSNTDLFMYLIGEMDSEYMTVKYSDKPGTKVTGSEVKITERDSTQSKEMTGNNF